jgi:hypothetical protein
LRLSDLAYILRWDTALKGLSSVQTINLNVTFLHAKVAYE